MVNNVVLGGFTRALRNAGKIAFLVLYIIIPLLFCTGSVRFPTNDKFLRPEEVRNNYALKEEVEPDKPREAVVVIDPGHGGADLGTCYGNLYEKDISLDISRRMGNLLENTGVKVVFTREKDIFVGLRERSDLANKIEATLFMSVHINEMAGDASYKGTETLYAVQTDRGSGKMDAEILATLVQRELVKNLKSVNNGIISRPDLSVLHRTRMPAVIAEIAYLSNASDRRRLQTDEFREKAAEALSNAVVKALNKMGINRDPQGKWMVDKGVEIRE